MAGEAASNQPNKSGDCGSPTTTKRGAGPAEARFNEPDLIVARYLMGTKPTCSTIF